MVKKLKLSNYPEDKRLGKPDFPYKAFKMHFSW